jgi:hypothetical protein
MAISLSFLVLRAHTKHSLREGVALTGVRGLAVCLVLAGVHGPSLAQDQSALRASNDATLAASAASTPVPGVDYRSLFQDLPKGVEATTLDWKTSNATVGQFKRGHADVLKWEAERKRATTQTNPSAVPGAPISAMGSKP